MSMYLFYIAKGSESYMERRVNMNVSNVICQLQEIDYSLLLDIMKPIIIYYITYKGISTYKLHKDFKAKVGAKIALPPEVVQRSYGIDKERLLKQKFGESIVNFATTITRIMPDADLTLFYNNLSNLTTTTKNFKISNLLLNSDTQGSYGSKSNQIMLQEDNYTLTIDHELFHMASSFYRESDGMIFSGFMQETKDKKSIGAGINEGYTQLLAERYFEENLKAYSYEKSIVEKLEMVVGKEKMESLYLNANLYGLIQELKQYEEENTIMQFIADMDFLNRHSSEKSWLPTEKNMTIPKLKNVNNFLLSCYLKKIKMDNNELDIELLSEKFINFIVGIPLELKKGNKEYVFMEKEDIMDTIDKVLKSLKGRENNTGQYESFSSKEK